MHNVLKLIFVIGTVIVVGIAAEVQEGRINGMLKGRDRICSIDFHDRPGHLLNVEHGSNTRLTSCAVVRTNG